MTTPDRCAACGTPLPEGAKRCPGCAAVIGEDNRCPHCNALAAVRPGPNGYVCLACGKPRAHLPGTIVNPSAGAKGANRFLRKALGAGLILGAALMGTALVLTGGLIGVGELLVGGLMTAAGVGLGAWLLRSGPSAPQEALAPQRTQELQILSLAEKMRGRLRATDVARAMGLSPAEADALLSSMCDGSRITAEVTPDGILEYYFRELRLPPQEAEAQPPIRARVESTGEAEEAALSQSELAAAEREIDDYLDG